MRIAQLLLIAYGPFRGLELDLSAPGIHVVFGRNEAGKSTTLRAITGLLYGIDTRTPDAHVHKPAELRIGGTLTGADGKSVRVVRRKGVSKGGPNTLLDERGQAIDEAVVQKLLCGVSEETFRHAFGLDHPMLQEGAKALLAGGGDVGGSLFDASVGGGGDARRLLEQLTNEAERLYKPRAPTAALNAVLKELAEAQKAIKDKQSLPEAFGKQEKEIEEARKRRAEYAARRAELSTRRAQIERARRRVPLEKRRAQLAQIATELGDVVRHAARITSLHTRLASYERARAVLRDESLEADRLRDRVGDAARRAGVDSGSAALRVDGRKESRIQRLLEERAKLTDRLDILRTELARSERDLARLRAVASPSGVPEAAVSSQLARAVEGARALGDATARHAVEKRKAARKRAEVAAKAKALGPIGTASLAVEVAVEDLVALQPPSGGVLDELAARAAELDRVLARHVDTLDSIESHVLQVEQQLAEASGDFAPPTRADLEAARSARDEAWTRVRDARGSVADPKALAALDSGLDRATRDADVVADRMIVEADRVTTLARYRAALEKSAQQRTDAVAKRDSLVADRAALDDEHRRLWAIAGITKKELGLAEMRGWLGKHEHIVDAFSAVREAELDAEETAKKIEAARVELVAALGDLREPVSCESHDLGASAGSPGEEPSLVELLDRAVAHVEAIDTTRRNVADAARRIEDLEREIEERKANIARDEETMADVRARLVEVVAPLGVPDDASAEEVTRALAALRDLFALEDQRAGAEARAQSAREEVQVFEDETARAVTDVATDLVGRPAHEVVVELNARAQRATAAARDLENVAGQLAELGNDAVPEDIAQLVLDVDAASRAVDDIDSEIQEVERDSTKADQAIWSAELGLQEMRGDSGAAEKALEAQEALARVRVVVERYVRARAAAFILGREIERYRQENQGPMLTNASQLFARLTLGAYTGVSAGYDDKDRPALKCIRSGNVEVDIAGLSEGTRDQLYLSLRLASLLRYADLAEPMPLVLDDVFIQFDDERSRAALEVIAELATRMQVLFFTHHARLVELARAAVPSSSLTIHELANREAHEARSA